MTHTDGAVRLSFQDGHPYVSIAPSWREDLTAEQLVVAVRDAWREAVPAASDDAFLPPRLPRITLAETPQFNDLMRAYNEARRDARLARRANPPTRSESGSRRKVAAVWHGSSLVGLQPDPEWLERASAQAVSDAFTSALDGRPTTAEVDFGEVVRTRRALTDFLGVS